MSTPEKLSPEALIELILLSFDGKTSPEQFKLLEQQIIHYQDARDLYYKLLTVSSGLSEYNNSGVLVHSSGDTSEAILGHLDNVIEGVAEAEKDESRWQHIWKQLAEYEKNAPTVEIPKQQAQRELTQNVFNPPRGKNKLGKFGIFTLVNAAAMILLVIVLTFIPSKSGIEVATVTDSLQAKWADVNLSMDNGKRIATGNDWFVLQKGYAELLFDNNTKVTVEAPAEFQILAEDRVGLKYGKLYAAVSNEAIGFSIYTNNAKIIDMGTEFGIEADTFGSTQLHVVKGKTMLLVGDKSSKSSVEVTEGIAKKISGSSQAISDIPYDDRYFVRAFDSASKTVWKQQPSLDLADMVRKGNGMGTGNSDARLDPIKGFTSDWHNRISLMSNRYLTISDHPFIDGVFVPDGQTSQIVTSNGDVFAECPDTSGLFDVDLFANPKPEILGTEYREGTIRFDGKEYTDKNDNTCIIMHANRGLTFDLQAMRNQYQRGIERFTSKIGIADLKEMCPCKADFYVLVDGQIRYSLRQYTQKGVLNDVSIEIKDMDRFLTLVTTDGGDADFPDQGFYKRAISCDWCVFTDPILVLK